MSLRQAILNGLLHIVAKPRLAHLQDPAGARFDLEMAGRYLLRRPPSTLALDLVLAPGLAGLSIRSGPVQDPGAVVLYFHGGAYLAGSPRSHLPMLARIARLAQVEVIAPDYRLAPEHPFPAALEDAEAAWNALVARGYAPSRVVLGGDSAGGGLALALLARLCQRGTPPAGLFGLSPWTDLTASGRSLVENAAKDPMLTAARVPEVARMYLQGHRADDPGASPLFAAFPGCPPVLLQYSETEILRDDVARMAVALARSGAEVTEQVWPRAPHVWQMFDGYIPEARAALNGAARAIRAMLSARPVSAGS